MNELDINSVIQRILSSSEDWVVQDSYEALRSAGEQIVPNVISALRRCASGAMSETRWWDGAQLLCELLREINTQSAKNALLLMLNTDSRIAEFEYIRIGAARNLGATDDPTLIPELLSASKMTHAPLVAIKQAIKELGGEMPMTPELIIQEGVDMWGQERLEHFRRYEQEVANWPGGLQCAYYWFYGVTVEKTVGVQAALPYYAASVLANPGPNAAAWDKFAGVHPSFKTARSLSQRYPLPSGNTTTPKRGWFRRKDNHEEKNKLLTEEKNKPLTREDFIHLRQKAGAPARLDLSNRNLTGIDLSGADLCAANLRGANLTEANLSNSNLRRAHLSEANLTNANLTEANLTKADLGGAIVSEATLRTAKSLQGATMPGGNTYKVPFTREDVIRFRQKAGAPAILDLQDSNLKGIDLSEVDLRGVNLQSANLTEANLSNADLTEANLSGANLTVANLSGANLTKVNLKQARVSDATMRTAKSLQGATMPGGFIHP